MTIGSRKNGVIRQFDPSEAIRELNKEEGKADWTLENQKMKSDAKGCPPEDLLKVSIESRFDFTTEQDQVDYLSKKLKRIDAKLSDCYKESYYAPNKN